jgi:hypothetical protein
MAYLLPAISTESRREFCAESISRSAGQDTNSAAVKAQLRRNVGRTGLSDDASSIGALPSGDQAVPRITRAYPPRGPVPVRSRVLRFPSHAL